MEVQKTKDNLPLLQKRLEDLFKPSVLVGIFKYQEEALHAEYGEPLLGIHATPFLEPGMKDANIVNKEILGNGISDVLINNKKPETVLKEVGENSVKTIKEYAEDEGVKQSIINGIDYEVQNA